MRHGPRGAAELAETVDRLTAFAATTDAVASELSISCTTAYVADPDVCAFLCAKIRRPRRRLRTASMPRGGAVFGIRAAMMSMPASRRYARRSTHDRPGCQSSQRRGACPGLSAPMPTGDGLLVRLVPIGTIPLAAFRTLCAAARTHGNGVMEVTARGSIQVRGLNAASAPRFAAAVAALNIAAEDGIPVHSNPLAGLDAEEILDAGALAADLRHALAERSLPAKLAPKVSVVVDGGGGLTSTSLLPMFGSAPSATNSGVALCVGRWRRWRAHHLVWSHPTMPSTRPCACSKSLRAAAAMRGRVICSPPRATAPFRSALCADFLLMAERAAVRCAQM